MIDVDTLRTNGLAAAKAVFNTTELLERVLTFLPSKDILLTQRVSSDWKAVIEGSVTLQRLLFNVPCHSTSTWVYEKNHETRKRSLKLCDQDTKNAQGESHGRSTTRKLLRTAILNPMVVPLYFQHYSSTIYCTTGVFYDAAIGLHLDAVAFYYSSMKKQSCRQQFLCQPPCTKVYAHYSRLYPCNDNEGLEEADPVVSRTDGVRLGDIMDLLEPFHHLSAIVLYGVIAPYEAEVEAVEKKDGLQYIVGSG